MGRPDDDFRREIDAHIALETDRLIAEGFSAADAHDAAMRRFGNPTAAHERFYESRRVLWFDHLRHDVRYAIQSFARTPVFTVVAVLTLALGIAATTAVFTQVNAVFLNPLPVRNPETLRTLSWSSPQRAFAKPIAQGPSWDARIAAGETISTFPHSAYLTMRDRAAGFVDLACWRYAGDSLAEWGVVVPQAVSGNYFQTLGLEAVAGRLLGRDDDRPGAPRVAVVSFRVWQGALGGTRDLSNRTIRIRETSFDIVGVLPDGFLGLDPMSPSDVMVAYAPDAETRAGGAQWSGCSMVGRLAADASDEAARAAVEVLLGHAIHASPPSGPYALPRVHLADMTKRLDGLRRSTGRPVMLVMCTASIILGIACANVAGLLLARGRARHKELATRLAIGALRSRIVRQLLTESLLLSAAGGVLGGWAAYALNRLLPRVLGDLGGLTQIGITVAPDYRVVAFCFAVTIVSGIVLGLLPAIRAMHVDLLSMMKPGAAPAGEGRGRFGGKTLVAAQVALSMILLIGAGLLLRTVINLRSVPIGYKPDGLLFVLTGNPPGRTRAFVDETLARLKGIPGVSSATVSQWPLFNNTALTFEFCVPGVEPSRQKLDLSYVFPGFFETWGVPLILGRDFDESLSPGLIVNETFATRFFGGRNPTGQMVGVNGCPGRSQAPIIGVVANHLDRQRVEQVPAVYMRYPRQGALYTTTYALRTDGDARGLVPAARRVLADLAIDPDGDVMTGVEYRDRTTRQERMLAELVTCFGIAALLISCLGIYGLLAYNVMRRTAEIGIRVALGARRADVVRMVVGESIVPVVVGIAVGLLGAGLLARFVETILFGVSTADPWTMGGAAIVLAITAGVAATMPALGATRIDASMTLRYH